MVEPPGVKIEIILYFECMLRCQIHASCYRFIISNCRFNFMVLFLSFDSQYILMLNDSFIQQREHTRPLRTHYSFIYIFSLLFSYSIRLCGAIQSLSTINSKIFILEFVFKIIICVRVLVHVSLHDILAIFGLGWA